jgi:hypothetical protein
MNRQQKTKPTFQITWIALVVVLQLLFLYLNQLYPFIGYWFTFLFPIFTILVLLSSTWRGLVIYAVTSMLLILMLIQPAIETMLFYWLPSFILGIGYVIGLKQKATLFSMVLFLSLTQLGVLYLLRMFSLSLYEVDLLAFIYLFFNLTDVANIFLLNPMMLYAIGLLQITISISFMIPVMERFGIHLPYQLMNAYFSDILEGPYRILSVIFIAIIPLALMMYKSFTQKKKNALIYKHGHARQITQTYITWGHLYHCIPTDCLWIFTFFSVWIAYFSCRILKIHLLILFRSRRVYPISRRLGRA